VVVNPFCTHSSVASPSSLPIFNLLSADHVVNVRKEDAVQAVRRLNGGKGVDYVVE
jgi:NADPH:quinone reductase-like Zn-dependent oxidoreductase